MDIEDTWKKTHQLAGRLWFFGGILAGVITLLLPEKAAIVAGFVT